MEGCFRWLRCWRNSGSSSWSKRPSRHPMHLHRHQLELVDFNGKPTSGLIKDTVVVPFYGRAAVEFTAYQRLQENAKLHRAQLQEIHHLGEIFWRQCLPVGIDAEIVKVSETPFQRRRHPCT